MKINMPQIRSKSVKFARPNRNMIFALTAMFFAAEFGNINSAMASGNGTSGGGGAYVCRDANGKVKDAELADLWEGKFLRHEPIAYSSDPHTVQLMRAMDRLRFIDPEFADHVQASLDYVVSHMAPIDIKSGVRLAAPRDAMTDYEKENCPLKGMMLFDDEAGVLHFDPEYFSHLLTQTDVAAALLHEAIYREMRLTDTWNYVPHTDSIGTRRLISKLFSSVPVTLAEDNLPKTDVMKCTGPDVEFYVYSRSVGGAGAPPAKDRPPHIVFTKSGKNLYPAGVSFSDDELDQLPKGRNALQSTTFFVPEARIPGPVFRIDWDYEKQEVRRAVGEYDRYAVGPLKVQFANYACSKFR